MADIINATIDDKQFEVYVRMMKERSENLKPVLAAAGNLDLIGALFEPEENLESEKTLSFTQTTPTQANRES